MRVSSYVIYASMPESPDCLLIHGYSGAIDVVPQSVADTLQQAEHKTDVGQLDLPEQMVATLSARGYLTKRTFQEEQDYCMALATVLHEQARQDGSYWFIPTYGCNLRCPYCFERGLRKETWFEQTMTLSMVDQAFTVIDQLDTGRSKRGPLGLFGGEPFLAANKDLIFYIVEQGMRRGYSFVAISNAVQLEPYLPLLGPGKVEYIQVTVDGPPDLNDVSRIQADRSGSFESISRNVSLALETGVRISMRTNVNRRNIGRIKELALLYQQLKWTNYPNFSAYSAPITEVDFLIARREKTRPTSQTRSESPAFEGESPPSKPPAFQKKAQALPIISTTAATFCGSCGTGGAPSPRSEQPLQTAAIQKKRLVTRLEMVNELLQDQPTEAVIHAGSEAKAAFKRLATTGSYKGYAVDYCSAYTGMLLFDPFGDMYACWDLVGKPEYAVGRFAPALLFNEERLALWRGHTVAAIPQCRQCKFALLHGGGCAYLALGEAGALLHPHCEDFPELFVKLAAIAYRELQGSRSSPQAAMHNWQSDSNELLPAH
jgi:uncharacterized protein